MRLPPVFMCVCFFADDIFESPVPAVAAIIARAAAVAATRARVDAVLAVAPTRARAVVVGQTRARKTAVGLAPSLAATSLVPASTRARPPWLVLVALRGVVLVLSGAATVFSGISFAPVASVLTIERPSFRASYTSGSHWTWS